MALEIKLNQKLSQTLVMTPQLQQAIKLLQLGRVEYLEVIEKELLENPVLEAVEETEESAEAQAGENQEVTSADNISDISDNIGELDSTAIVEIDAGSDSEVSNVAEQELTEASSTTGNGEDYFEWFGETGIDFSSVAPVGSEKSSVESLAGSAEGLASHLLWQLRTTELSESDKSIAAQIIGNLDRNGYLCSSIEEIAQLASCDAENVERVLAIVQTLDPSGVGARDLRECLLIQLEQIGLSDSLAWRIVSHHLTDVELRRYENIARAEAIAVEEIYEAIKIVQKLEPRPGRPFVDEAPVYITPDVYVRKVDDDFIVTLNDIGIPKLRLNSAYQQLAAGGSGKEGNEKEYLQDRIRSASWLIKSIQQRQQTIFKVTQSIVKFQREFLETGVAGLKPLVLREVAADVGMHESTISRVTTNKYVHTPQGVYELKFFFSSGLKSDGGEISSESVKERIRDLVAKEDSKKPLSDQAIVAILKGEGIDIARRTVAKYREMMNILSSSRRKKAF